MDQNLQRIFFKLQFHLWLKNGTKSLVRRYQAEFAKIGAEGLQIVVETSHKSEITWRQILQNWPGIDI